MSHRFRVPVRSRLAINKIQSALKRLRARLLSKEGGNVTDALSGVFKVFDRVLPRLGKPTFQPEYLAWDADPSPEDWNLNLENVEDDLRNLFAEVDELRNLRMETANAALLAGRELETKANMAKSLVADLRLTGGQLGQEVIVASDDFQSLDKIDQGFPLQYPLAEVNTLQGAVTLKRTEAVNVVTPDAGVDVTPILPDELVGKPDQGRLPTPNNVMRFYEGRFYSPLGEARPEGGRWHLEEKVRPGVVVAGDSTVFVLDDAAGEGIFDQFPDLRKAADERPQGFPLRPEDVVVIDRGASLVELQGQRRKLLDADADSFWECECVIDAKALDDLVAAREAEEAVVTPQELRALAANTQIDRFDFGVEIVIRLPRRQSMNFITINPMNFNETAWLEVLEVATAADETDAFVPIEGFNDQIFENVLTDRANSELTESETGTVLATSPFAYRGQGVYSFPPRSASRVRIRLKQRTPVPSNYERVVIQLTRTLSATESKFKGSCFPMGTMISTPDGPRRIEELQHGDLVWGHTAAGTVIETVRRTVRYKPEKVTGICLDDNRTLYTTPHHTLLTLQGWKRVGKLKLGDALVTETGGFHRITSFTLRKREEPVYNLYVTYPHNFVADGFVAHCYTAFPKLRALWHSLVWRV